MAAAIFSSGTFTKYSTANEKEVLGANFSGANSAKYSRASGEAWRRMFQVDFSHTNLLGISGANGESWRRIFGADILQSTLGPMGGLAVNFPAGSSARSISGSVGRLCGDIFAWSFWQRSCSSHSSRSRFRSIALEASPVFNASAGYHKGNCAVLKF